MHSSLFHLVDGVLELLEIALKIVEKMMMLLNVLVSLQLQYCKKLES